MQLNSHLHRDQFGLTRISCPRRGRAETQLGPLHLEENKIMRRSHGDFRKKQMKLRLISLLLAVACMGFGAVPPKPVSAPAQNVGLGGLPLSFEANQGQTDPTVKFFSRGSGYALFLTSDTAVFRLSSSRGDSVRAALSPPLVRMKLSGTNPNA